MFWEPHLLTLRVNANSVNAAATAEDEDEMRMRPRVESSELSSGRRWQNGARPEGKWVGRRRKRDSGRRKGSEQKG